MDYNREPINKIGKDVPEHAGNHVVELDTDLREKDRAQTIQRPLNGCAISRISTKSEKCFFHIAVY